MAVGSGYTLHYLDEETGEHVSVPLDQLGATRPKLVHDETVVVTFDEVGSFTHKDTERLSSQHPSWLKTDLSGLEVRALAQEASVVETDLDRRALIKALAKPELDNLSPYAPLEKRRPDWQDRGPKHNNRKKRSWRR